MALLTKSALQWLNKRCTAQSTLCVGNKIIIFLFKRAGRHFGFFKRAGRHEKGAGRRALQKKPRQNTVLRSPTGLDKGDLNGEVTVLQGLFLFFALWNTVWD